MSIADLKAQAQLIFDTFNDHDVAATLELFADDAVLSDIAFSRPATGKTQIAAYYKRSLEAIPDSSARVERMVGEGDTVVVEWTIEGTHGGRLMGIPPTDKHLHVRGVSTFRFRNGLIISHVRMWDVAGLLRQIGLLPEYQPPAPAQPKT